MQLISSGYLRAILPLGVQWVRSILRILAVQSSLWVRSILLLDTPKRDRWAHPCFRHGEG